MARCVNMLLEDIAGSQSIVTLLARQVAGWLLCGSLSLLLHLSPQLTFRKYYVTERTRVSHERIMLPAWVPRIL